MNDDATDFEATLEHLRQVSKAYLPNMAEFYGDGSSIIGSFSQSVGSIYNLETADFLASDDGKVMHKKWTELASLFGAALGHTGNTYWYTGQVFGWALDGFEEQDGVNADHLKALEKEAESSGVAKTHSGDYEPVELPEHKTPGS